MLDPLCPADVRDMHEAVNTIFDFDKRTKVCQVANPAVDPESNFVPVTKSIPGIRLNLFHPEANAPGLWIDAQYLDIDRVTDIYQLAGMLDTLGPAHFRYM